MPDLSPGIGALEYHLSALSPSRGCLGGAQAQACPTVHTEGVCPGLSGPGRSEEGWGSRPHSHLGPPFPWLWFWAELSCDQEAGLPVTWALSSRTTTLSCKLPGLRCLACVRVGKDGWEMLSMELYRAGACF